MDKHTLRDWAVAHDLHPVILDFLASCLDMSGGELVYTEAEGWQKLTAVLRSEPEASELWRTAVELLGPHGGEHFCQFCALPDDEIDDGWHTLYNGGQAALVVLRWGAARVVTRFRERAISCTDTLIKSYGRASPEVTAHFRSLRRVGEWLSERVEPEFVAYFMFSVDLLRDSPHGDPDEAAEMRG